MGSGIGEDNDSDLLAFTTDQSSVSGRLSLVHQAAGEAPEAEAEEQDTANEVVDEAPTKRAPAKKSTAKKAPAKKAPATKAVVKKPPIPASDPPKRPKVAMPAELFAEMNEVVNEWLRYDTERMNVYVPYLGKQNTRMVTLLAYATAMLKEELEKDGGASTTFPDYIPRKPGSDE